MSKKMGVAQAAIVVMVAMVISRILGFVRDVVIYTQFGQNRITDAYNAAFSIPDFLYMLLVGGALSSAFIPVFAGYLSTGKKEDAGELASVIFTSIVVLMGVGIVLGIIFTPQLVKLLVPGFGAESAALTEKLTRVMFIQSFFMALSGVSMGILNSHGNFLVPATGSVLYNLGTIVVGLLLSPYLGIMGFSIGVVAGAAANFFVQVPALLRANLRFHPSFNLRHPGVRQVIILFIPVVFGLSVTQLNLFVNQNLASQLEPGIVAALRTGQRLMQLPIGIFAIAVAVASFPTLTGQVARGEMKAFGHTLSSSLRSIIFFNLPAALGLIVLREPIIRFLFEQGKFTAEATKVTGDALLYYALGLLAWASIQVLNRAFYALNDTRTPVMVGVLTIGLNLAFNLLLVGPLAHRGLALAYSLGGLINAALLVWLLQRRTSSINTKGLFGSGTRVFLAAAIMSLAAAGLASGLETRLSLVSKLDQFLQVATSVAVGGAVYLVTAYIFGLQEVKDSLGMISRRFRR